MAEEFKTSFIPKKTVEVGKRRRRSSMSIFMLGGIVVFFIAVLASGGLFVYQRLIVRSIEKKQDALARAQEAFEPSLIRELSRLDERIGLVNTLLNEHVAPSSLLEVLEEVTLATVRFESFNFSIPENEEEGIKLVMNGSAVGFNAVALQSDEFAKNEYLKDPIFSSLSVAETGEVTFSVTATVDPKLFIYEPPREVDIVPDVELDLGTSTLPEIGTSTIPETGTSTAP